MQWILSMFFCIFSPRLFNLTHRSISETVVLIKLLFKLCLLYYCITLQPSLLKSKHNSFLSNAAAASLNRLIAENLCVSHFFFVLWGELKRTQLYYNRVFEKTVRFHGWWTWRLYVLQLPDTHKKSWKWRIKS